MTQLALFLLLLWALLPAPLAGPARPGLAGPCPRARRTLAPIPRAQAPPA
jgi:hypothetical protein